MVWRSDVSGRLAIMGTMGCRLTAASSAKEANWLFKAAANDAIVSLARHPLKLGRCCRKTCTLSWKLHQDKPSLVGSHYRCWVLLGV